MLRERNHADQDSMNVRLPTASRPSETLVTKAVIMQQKSLAVKHPRGDVARSTGGKLALNRRKCISFPKVTQRETERVDVSVRQERGGWRFEIKMEAVQGVEQRTMSEGPTRWR